MTPLPRSSRLPLLALSVALASCGGGSSDDKADGGGGASTDAAPLSCDERMPLTIGHCIDGNTSAPCVSAESEMQEFHSIDTDPTIHPIIGLQGSPMFVMAVQGQGIAPGEDLDAPSVDVHIYDGEQDVGGYTARPLVVESTETPGLMTAPRLFVVSFFAEDLVGKTLEVTAEVEDRNGQLWCGESSFEVGPLIDAPPLP